MANLQVGVAGNGTITVGAGASVHSPASNTLTLGTNGDERLRIDSSGNTVVNVTSATAGSYTYKLLTSDNISSSEQTLGIQYPSVVTYGLNAESNADFTIKKDGTERLRILSNGRIGVGTESSSSALQIYASDEGEGTAKGQITLKDTAAYNAAPQSGIVFQGHHASNNAQAIWSGIRGFKANAADGDYDGCLAFDVRKHGAIAYEAMRINEDGNIGINSTTPTFAAGGGVQLRGSGSDFTSFRVSASSNTGVDFSQASDGIGYLYNRDNEDVILGTNNTERFRIKAAGNLSSGGEGAPDVSAGGLCLNQGAADTNIFSLKSSDIAHGVTTYDETDTYFSIRKSSGDKGGARIHGFTDTAGGDAALEFQGIINSDADQGYCPIEFRGSEANGTGVQNIAADRRIVNIKNSDGTRIASFTGTGLTFGNDSAVVNALDDYEEGSFTGTWTAYTTAASTTATSTNYYTKIGQQVTCYINLANATIAGGGGPVQMTGLPFVTASTAGGGQTATTLLTYKVNFEDDRNQTFYTWQSVSFVLGYQSRANNTWVAWDVSNFHGGNRYCQFTFTYRTDS